MDQYGSFKHSREEANEVANYILTKHGTVVFTYSWDGFGAHIIFMSPEFDVLGTCPFGGNPRHRMYIGVYGRGCGHLSMEVGPHQNYIEEKLNLGKGDAEHFAEFYGWIVEYLRGSGAYDPRLRK